MLNVSNVKSGNWKLETAKLDQWCLALCIHFMFSLFFHLFYGNHIIRYYDHCVPFMRFVFFFNRTHKIAMNMLIGIIQMMVMRSKCDLFFFFSRIILENDVFLWKFFFILFYYYCLGLWLIGLYVHKITLIVLKWTNKDIN